MTNTALKAQIDSQITNETLPNSISPADVGGNLKAVVDYIDQEVINLGVVKTAGIIDADNVLFYKTLQFDLNTVNTTGASDKVILPTTTEIGKEVLVFASNNANAFSVRGNVSGTAVLSPNGVSSQVGNVSIAANVSYRFIHLGEGYWKAELI